MLEDILLLILDGSAVFFIGIPFFQLVNKLVPRKRNTLAEAKARLEQARLDAEAARLNKEAERIYNELYEDVLHEDDDDEETTKHNRRV